MFHPGKETVEKMRPCRNIRTLIRGLLLVSLVAWPGWAGAEEKAQASRDAAAAAVAPQAEEKRSLSEIEALRSELAKEPGNAREHIRLGWLLLGEGGYDAAISSFDQALQLNPRSSDAKAGKGAALARKGELAAAEAILKDALVLNPNPVRVHYELGLLYDRLGAPDKALAEYKTAIEKYRQGRR